MLPLPTQTLTLVPRQILSPHTAPITQTLQCQSLGGGSDEWLYAQIEKEVIKLLVKMKPVSKASEDLRLRISSRLCHACKHQSQKTPSSAAAYRCQHAASRRFSITCDPANTSFHILLIYFISCAHESYTQWTFCNTFQQTLLFGILLSKIILSINLNNTGAQLWFHLFIGKLLQKIFLKFGGQTCLEDHFDRLLPLKTSDFFLSKINYITWNVFPFDI